MTVEFERMNDVSVTCTAVELTPAGQIVHYNSRGGSITRTMIEAYNIMGVLARSAPT